MNHAAGYSALDKNNVLCRKDLDMIPYEGFDSTGYDNGFPVHFLKINGVANFWEEDAGVDETVLVRDILTSTIRYNLPFCFAIKGNRDGIHIYVGTIQSLRDSLRSSYEAMFPGIDIDPVETNPFADTQCKYGGVFTGFPTDKLAGEKKTPQIESICRGMLGKSFVYMVVAQGLSTNCITLAHDRILKEMENTLLSSVFFRYKSRAPLFTC